MKLTQLLLDMIEEADIDEGSLLSKVMLDPDSSVVEMQEAIYDFLIAYEEYNSSNELIVDAFISNHLLEDEDDDFTIDDDEDEDEVDIDECPEFVMLREDNIEDNKIDEEENWLEDD